jgi:hypothetical protein
MLFCTCVLLLEQKELPRDCADQPTVCSGSGFYQHSFSQVWANGLSNHPADSNNLHPLFWCLRDRFEPRLGRLANLLLELQTRHVGGQRCARGGVLCRQALRLTIYVGYP